MNQSLYREFCRDHAAVPLFAQPWYLDAVCEGGRWGAAIVQQDDRAVAAMPFFLKQRGPFRYVAMPHFVKHLGPYLLPSYQNLKQQHRLYDELISQLPPHHAFKQDLHISVTNWLPFYWRGFRQTTRYTYQIGLQQGQQGVYENFNRNMRRNIRKAEQQLIVRKDMAPEKFYHINQLSFRRQGLNTPYSLPLFLRHDAALAAHNARQIFAAEDAQGRLHSVAYLTWDGHTSYYHLSGDNPELRQSGAGILLAWEAMRFAMEELQLPVFDFEGSMMPNIEAIRRQFGARQVPYFRVWKYSSKLYQVLDWLKNWQQ